MVHIKLPIEDLTNNNNKKHEKREEKLNQGSYTLHWRHIQSQNDRKHNTQTAQKPKAKHIRKYNKNTNRFTISPPPQDKLESNSEQRPNNGECQRPRNANTQKADEERRTAKGDMCEGGRRLYPFARER